MRAEVEASPDLAAHLITYTEMRAMFASRLSRKLIRTRDYGAVLGAFEEDWETFTRVAVNEAMMPDALLNTGAGELDAQLRELEADTPPAELDRWAAAFEGNPKEASAKGELVNLEASG